ncbi:hypothetical protein HU200_065882 [Digitaria exilis]|uniref:Uncharacterized protein n=1 Tax=Digitaria exilis TaxID=1010633 RepID=A0A835A324_9POAL|nr:hypothetical protein HU200_065882 [Digitaria exilis]
MDQLRVAVTAVSTARWARCVLEVATKRCVNRKSDMDNVAFLWSGDDNVVADPECWKIMDSHGGHVLLSMDPPNPIWHVNMVVCEHGALGRRRNGGEGRRRPGRRAVHPGHCARLQRGEGLRRRHGPGWELEKAIELSAVASGLPGYLPSYFSGDGELQDVWINVTDVAVVTVSVS